MHVDWMGWHDRVKKSDWVKGHNQTQGSLHRTISSSARNSFPPSDRAMMLFLELGRLAVSASCINSGVEQGKILFHHLQNMDLFFKLQSLTLQLQHQLASCQLRFAGQHSVLTSFLNTQLSLQQLIFPPQINTHYISTSILTAHLQQANICQLVGMDSSLKPHVM